MANREAIGSALPQAKNRHAYCIWAELGPYTALKDEAIKNLVKNVDVPSSQLVEGEDEIGACRNEENQTKYLRDWLSVETR